MSSDSRKKKVVKDDPDLVTVYMTDEQFPYERIEPPPPRGSGPWRHSDLFRPIKQATNVRIDIDVLNWLKSKGPGHLTRLNDILRATMLAEIREQRLQQLKRS